MITKLEEYLEIFHEEDFHDIVISAKSIDPLLVIDAYTEISRRFDYPLHLGVTHAGPRETGSVGLRITSPGAGSTWMAGASSRALPPRFSILPWARAWSVLFRRPAGWGGHAGRGLGQRHRRCLDR
jgi:hypothetical protein